MPASGELTVEGTGYADFCEFASALMPFPKRRIVVSFLPSRRHLSFGRRTVNRWSQQPAACEWRIADLGFTVPVLVFTFKVDQGSGRRKRPAMSWVQRGARVMIAFCDCH